MEAEQQATAENGTVEPEPIERKNLIQILREWPLSRKLAAGGVILISIVLFAVLIIQSRVADHQLLYANLTETDAASVVTWLKGQRVPYTLKNGGRNIWIPADRIYETRLDLASNGLPSGGGVGYEVFDNQSFALTDYVQKVNYTRALQGELARTISSLAPVETTRVHLALPEKRLFKNQQKKATASVIVTLGKGRKLDGSQVKGIIHLVAGSVTGLEPGDVKVIDSNGLVLETDEPSDLDKMLSVDMLAFQREVENRLEMRAQALLDKTMGKDMAMVRVTATLDFAKVEKTEELFDAEEPVIRSEQINTETSSGQSTGGIPGVQSNLQGNAAGASNTGQGSSRNSRTTNYEISKTINKIVNPVGTITKLSVSVLVSDKTTKDETSGELQVVPRNDEELDSLKEMVSAALGLSPRRGDQINIVSMPFIDPPPAEIDKAAITAEAVYQYIPLVKIALVPLGAFLIYFLLIRPIIKTMRGDLKEHYKTVEEMERERLAASQPEPEVKSRDIRNLSPDEQMATLRKNVVNSPTQTAFIIKNWINEG
ncbi:flagellar basal-body MS-ring/collar protein FliF [Desulfopila sp. IMCC35008]|uniref:flagellar basal-body MS-ring/collar protein FliF n=1 Tax=Desulfopila sp. IMCC35008 TaxID=2653858 RepID=UPI0013D87EE7|nr:flagellar basal-body MS-ring/collar protein FliF [Desulfopila sp. IMCC35008]